MSEEQARSKLEELQKYAPKPEVVESNEQQKPKDVETTAIEQISK
jgi:hypothetical protein